LWTSLSRATILGLLLGRWQGMPTICWQHAAFLKPGNRRLLRALQSRALLWVADSQSVAQLTAIRLHVEPQRLMTWPIFAADAAAPVSAAWRPGQLLRIGSLGRLHPVKGYDVLVAALALLRAQAFRAPVEFALTIAGEGAERGRLEAMLRDAGISQMRMPGFVDDPQQFLAQQHLYLQPSRSEGFCIGVHQAMVAGLPVLASAVGEISHSVQSGVTGYVVPPRDPAALALQLRNVLSSPERLHGIGNAGRLAVLQKYSQRRFVAAGEAILNRVAA
jgi:glycosyltransferase involved in cell wall biosynthesis